MGFDLQIELEEIDQKIILHLEGRLDAATTPLLERKIQSLIAEHRTVFLLDFASIDYLSSAGLRLLLAASKQLKARGGALILYALQEEVMDIIKLASFEKILLLFGTEEEALQYLP